ncbi:hypothetical protein [Chlorobium ferrooxidans]|uniref:Uncharacterized protein n=1 Tax=Chlorobium ferrooxidans DSM 13031 TaxID=377431 RepID=Q0YS98_9CHLB|nr:hypothetical protein [Chlorobium ferrooxidans]EAT59094.1 conserved hypothetical protein [Chlorobium ferrooxidans DSM 13031]
MKPRLPHKTFVINWLKALMLSPGILFPMAYLLLYLSTNIFLNKDYKKDLTLSFNRATGNSLHIKVASLKAGLIFDSVTLNQIELTSTVPVEGAKSSSGDKITIKSMKINSPDLQNILFSQCALQASTEQVCEKILAGTH